MPSPFAVHTVFETLGYLSAVLVYLALRKRQGDPIGDRERMAVFAGALVGAALGTRLLFLLCNPSLTLQHWSDPRYLLGGKTIVGGLLGGLIGVETAKKIAGIRRSTGDPLVLPIIAAISVGRIGCFLVGPADGTAGLPSSLPWAIAMGDAVPRHPVALYEIAFVLLMVPVVMQVRRRSRAEGDSFRVFLSSYLLFRFLVDFLKPSPPPLPGGLTAIQWACLAGLAYYGAVFGRRFAASHERATA